jgi:DNA polymerase-3 subunit alpha
MTGYFKPRYNRVEFEFKVEKMMMLESIKPVLTKQVVLDLEARHLNENMIRFVEKNMKQHPGKSTLKINIVESRSNSRITMHTLENGFEMNDEMAAFLQSSPEFEVQIISS